MLGVAQWGCLCVHFPGRAACVGMLQDVESLGVGGHQSILDSVVHHLDEVAGSRWPAMQVALFGGSRDFLASRCSGNVAASRGERLEDRIEMLHDLLFPA